jgi:hypothetical protein
MRHLRTNAIITCLVTFVAGASAGPFDMPEPGDMLAQLAQEGIDVPEAWAGVWEFTWTIYDCDSEIVVDTGESQETLCVNDEFIEPEEGPDITCTGTVNATTVNLECTGSEEILPGCTASYDYEFDAVRDGDSMVGTAIVSITFAGDCPVTDICTRQETTGERVGPAPEDCGQTPVLQRPWGAIKQMYR